MITEHFTIEELSSTSHDELREANRAEAMEHLESLKKVCTELEKVRTFFGKAVKVSSGYRSEAVNKAVGGSPTSQHCKGEAADFTVDGYEDSSGLLFVFYWCGNNLNYGQLIMERPEGKKPWIHVSLPRVDKARERLVWNGKGYEAV